MIYFRFDKVFYINQVFNSAMHNKFLNRYYFINKFDQSHLDKQNKEVTIIYRNHNQVINKKLILKIKNISPILLKKDLSSWVPLTMFMK